ncbi:MAG: hypothetical protein E5X43_33165 [Mesorhizobium sp.]|uniref:hypothetical protein n=1 Tax=Mesorhizobium sp. TaxID=1871066 RepID=UPI0012269480|nr:hypothetical protein [Mesorhizobium sp.]TJW71520.1 MAG: hypothetical protein E5X43_33165 [Mesorhizobium sp.]
MTNTINVNSRQLWQRFGEWIFRDNVDADTQATLSQCDMQFVHCNICGDRYDPVVGHLLLPDAMPALNAVHLLPRCISNRAHCHLLPAVGFFFV